MENDSERTDNPRTVELHASDDRAVPQQAGALTPEAILQLGLGFWASKTLLSAVELGIFTQLGSGPLPADELIERIGLHRRAARDFLDALVALGMLERGGGSYANTPATDQFLDRNKQAYIGGLLEMANARLYSFWGHLTEALRTGRPQNEVKHGGDLFAGLYADADRLASFLKAMTGISMGSAIAIAKQFPWAQYKTFADIGTAQGGLTVQVALAHSHLEGWGFDLPAVRPHFDAFIGQHGLSGRIRFQVGDFCGSVAVGRRIGHGARAARLGTDPEKDPDREGLCSFAARRRADRL